MNTLLLEGSDAIGMFCRQYMRSKKDIPIRSSEMGVLIYAHKEGTPITPGMISEFFKIAKPSVTTLLIPLVDKGYLIKESSVIDRRSYTVKLSLSGKKLVEVTFDEYYKSMELLQRNMGVDEFSLFVGLIQKANTILREEL